MVTQALGGMVLSCRPRGDWVEGEVPGGLSGYIRSWGVRPLEEGSPWLHEPGVVVTSPWARVRFPDGGRGLLPSGVRCLVQMQLSRTLRIVTPWEDEARGDGRDFRSALELIGQGIYGRPAESPEQLDSAGIHLMLMRVGHRAPQFLGVPYLWGGLTSGGMDCSGLVWMSAALEGALLPRDAVDQCSWFRKRIPGRAPDRKELVRPRLGGLLFFGSGLRSVDHVGIGVGGGRFLHASRRVRFSSMIPGSEDFESRLRERLVWVV